MSKLYDFDDPLLRPGLAAKMLGITTETLRRWMRSGVISYSLIGPSSRKRILRSVIDANLLERGQVVPVARCVRGVYFIAGAERVKIGKSASVCDRLIMLQICSPVTLQPVGFIPCETASEMKRLEAELHQRFVGVRSHGEWFIDCPELRAFIAERVSMWPAR